MQPLNIENRSLIAQDAAKLLELKSVLKNHESAGNPAENTENSLRPIARYFDRYFQTFPIGIN